MTPDYNKAATKAAETLIKYGVDSFPVSPIPILKKMENVLLVSFADVCSASGVERKELVPLFGKGQDAVTSIHEEGGNLRYIVAYNSMLPHTMVHRALARELGHIVLKHRDRTPEADAEARCFSHHLLCPRPLIHTLQAIGIRITKDLLANITGVVSHCLFCMRHIPGTKVPARLNRFVRSQIMPFVMNFFDYYQEIRYDDGSALADLGSYMEMYEE